LRPIALAAIIIAILAITAFLAWSRYFAPVTVSVAPVESHVREQVFGLGTVGARAVERRL
jgi:uncharacterized protein involved in response to NO